MHVEVPRDKLLAARRLRVSQDTKEQRILDKTRESQRSGGRSSNSIKEVAFSMSLLSCLDEVMYS